MEIKEGLKAFRKSQGYERAVDFCAAVGISYGSFQKYEAGRVSPAVDVVVKIADRFGVSVDAVIGRDLPAEQAGAERQHLKENAESIRAAADEILKKLG